MSFVDTFYDNLAAHPDRALLIEVHGEALEPAPGSEIAALVARARGALRTRGVKPGDRVVLLAPNGVRWAASDLAILGEGAIVVPMYARQDPAELVEMMHDCDPRAVIVPGADLGDAIAAHWPEAPLLPFEALFAGEPVDERPRERADDDVVTIIYTSGSTGVPKGVMLTAGNVAHMLPCTATALERMTGRPAGNDRVFHYLPFCFAGSRILLWTCLLRANPLMVSTDLDDLARELGTARPNYFLNVPVLLDRIRNGVEAGLADKPAPVRWLYRRGKAAFERAVQGRAGRRDRLALTLANRVVFGAIQQRIGPELECLICGSAPLAESTQRWFEMIGIPVYQVYGLTETTAIVTMDRPAPDDPHAVVPGRVGPAIDGVAIRLSEDGELQTRGPNVFAGYWGREEATAAAFTEDGWLRSGDRADVDAAGRYRIIGRMKNLLVPSSGHNVAPEPLEQRLQSVSGVEQALVVGHGRPFLSAILTGDVDAAALCEAVDALNDDLPHYRRIRRFHVTSERFTIENGLLTATQKVRRDAIEQHFADPIEEMYR